MNLEKGLGKNNSKKERRGCSLAGRRQPTGPASEASPGLLMLRPRLLPTRSVTAAPRAPDHVRPTAPRGRHARLASATTPLLRCGQRHVLRHSRLHPVRSLSLSLALPRLFSARAAPPPAIGASRAPSAWFPALRRLPAPPSTSPSSAFVFACSDVTSSRRLLTLANTT